MRYVEDDCARALGMPTPTLVKWFPEEIANGTARKRAEVIGLLYKSALSSVRRPQAGPRHSDHMRRIVVTYT